MAVNHNVNPRPLTAEVLNPSNKSERVSAP